MIAYTALDLKALDLSLPKNNVNEKVNFKLLVKTISQIDLD